MAAADIAFLLAKLGGLDRVNGNASTNSITIGIFEQYEQYIGNIDNISMSRRSPDFTELTIDLEVYDLKHLSAIINQLRAKTIVARVDRVNG